MLTVFRHLFAFELLPDPVARTIVARFERAIFPDQDYDCVLRATAERDLFRLKFPPSIELYLARKRNNNREYLSNWQKQKRERVGM